MSGGGRLAELLEQVGAGAWLPADGRLTVLPQPSPRDCAVLAFTGHHVVVADVDPGWVRAQLPPGDLSAPLCPPFLHALCALTGRRAGSIDLVAVAAGVPGPPGLPLVEIAGAAAGSAGGHPRLGRAWRYRSQVRAWACGRDIVILGRGLGGRWEVAVEVDPAGRGRGTGRALATAARHLAPPGAALWAQVAPGNAASVRAFLAAGYAPVGAEALLVSP